MAGRTRKEKSWKLAEKGGHQAAVLIDRSSLEVFLRDQGFDVLSYSQPWRSVHAVLTRRNRYFFFKLASTESIGRNLENEVAFNRVFNRYAKRSDVGREVRAPRCLEVSEWCGCRYYVAEYFEPNQLATFVPADSKGLRGRIDLLVDLFWVLFEMRRASLWGLYPKQSRSGLYELFVAQTEERLGCVRKKYLRLANELFSRLNLSESEFVSGFSHGDLTPWHIFRNGDGAVVIDGEHGSSARILFFDLAYFCYRTATCLGRFDVARGLLRGFYQRLNREDRDLFELLLPQVLVVQAINSLADLSTFPDQKPLEKFHQRFVAEVLDRKLLKGL